MGLKSLFRRKTAAAAPTPAAPIASPAPAPEEPLSPEALAELKEAWDELTAAAKEAGVKSFHACTRSGEPWQTNLASVRAMTTTIRNLSKDETGKKD